MTIDLRTNLRPGKPLSALMAIVVMTLVFAALQFGCNNISLEPSYGPGLHYVRTDSTWGYAYDLTTRDSVAYVVTYAGLEGLALPSVGLSDHVRAYPCGQLHGISIRGDYAYLAACDSGLRIVDVSGDYVAGRSRTPVPGTCEKVAVAGNYAYVATGDSGLAIVDVSDPALPAITSSFPIGGYTYDVVESDSYAYLAVKDKGLVVVNVSDPARPILTGTSTAVTSPRSIYVSGQHAYVADSVLGVAVFDISDPANPRLITSFNPTGSAPSYAEHVLVKGGLVYVASGPLGIQILGLSDSWKFSKLAEFHTSDWAKRIAVVNNRVYVAAMGAGVVELVCDPGVPWDSFK